MPFRIGKEINVGYSVSGTALAAGFYTARR